MVSLPAKVIGIPCIIKMIATITDIAHQLYVHPESRAQASQIQEQRGLLHGFEFEAYRKDGEKIWLSLNMRVIRDDQGAEVCREGTIEDITERKQAESRIAHMAHHDALTDLPNRVLFRQRLEQELLRIRRGGQYTANPLRRNKPGPPE